MTIEENGSIANQDFVMDCIELVPNAPNLLQHGSLIWEEKSPEKFVCYLCKKSFYNAKALQNHNNLQHDPEDFSSKAEQIHGSVSKNDQFVEDMCSFKYIPRKDETTDTSIEVDGLTKCVFNEDTSFLIVKIEGDDEFDANALRRSRLDGAKGRNQMKAGKQPIDLRGPFTCTLPSTVRPDLQCRQIFFNCCEYSLHYREEHTKRRKAALRCQVCEKRLDKDFYSSMLAPQFSAPSCLTFSCRICAQTFISSADYDEHNRVVHAKMKPHQCPVCTKRFTQQGGLQQHMRMHTGIRPFACTFCPKAFTQKAGLDQHLRTHTKVKPFKCVICGKCFSQSVHLRQHMRTHTNIQPFECSACGRRFKQSSHLNFHMRSHADEANSLTVEKYAQVVQEHNRMEFLNLANVQQVQDGETLYYAAELASTPCLIQNTFIYPSDIMLPQL